MSELKFVVGKCYSNAYFDAGLDSEENYWMFQLPIGETAQMKLGFLVKESDTSRRENWLGQMVMAATILPCLIWD